MHSVPWASVPCDRNSLCQGPVTGRAGDFKSLFEASGAGAQGLGPEGLRALTQELDLQPWGADLLFKGSLQMPLENEWGWVAGLQAAATVRRPLQVSGKGPGHVSRWTVGRLRAESCPFQGPACSE